MRSNTKYALTQIFCLSCVLAGVTLGSPDWTSAFGNCIVAMVIYAIIETAVRRYVVKKREREVNENEHRISISVNTNEDLTRYFGSEIARERLRLAMERVDNRTRIGSPVTTTFTRPPQAFAEFYEEKQEPEPEPERPRRRVLKL